MDKKTRDTFEDQQKQIDVQNERALKLEFAVEKLKQTLTDGEILQYEVDQYNKSAPPRLVSKLDNTRFGRNVDETRTVLFQLLRACGYEVKYHNSCVEVIKSKKAKRK